MYIMSKTWQADPIKSPGQECIGKLHVIKCLFHLFSPHHEFMAREGRQKPPG